MTLTIAIDIGHNVTPDGGAVGFGNENWMNTAVGSHLISLLTKAGVKVITCKPLTAVSLRQSLQKRVSVANEADADYYVSLHHNAGGGNGCETFYVSDMGCKLATEICKQIAELGFKNRGAKRNTHFFVINQTDMPAVLVETCFVDSQSDVKLWNSVGAEAVAKAIYDGLNAVLRFTS